MAALLLAWFVSMAAVSAAICWGPVQDLRELHRIAQWPVVQAAITAPRVEYRHFAERRHQPAMNAWCTRWGYDYAWQGAHHGGELADDAGNLPERGCYVYEAGARHAAARRPAGSALAVRVDPSDPWASTTRSTDIPLGDIGILLFGLFMAALPLGALVSALRAHRASRRRAADPASGPKGGAD